MAPAASTPVLGDRRRRAGQPGRVAKPRAMVPAWLTVLSWLSIGVALLCSAAILVDVLRHPQPMAIMNWVWPITALYGGPLAVWMYARLGRPSPHERPFYSRVAVDATHCGAG